MDVFAICNILIVMLYEFKQSRLHLSQKHFSLFWVHYTSGTQDVSKYKTESSPLKIGSDSAELPCIAPAEKEEDKVGELNIIPQ